MEKKLIMKVHVKINPQDISVLNGKAGDVVSAGSPFRRSISARYSRVSSVLVSMVAPSIEDVGQLVQV